ncbi:MAG TPA: hypothetical protein VJQ79_13245 [Acidimicrobiia bacterium]|nr:hypothetical protein [Acidimicrobiia bacterium]
MRTKRPHRYGTLRPLHQGDGHHGEVFAVSNLAADATFAGKKYAVVARRTGIQPLRASTNGFEGMVAGLRLIKRWLQKDTRFDVLVWN